MQAMKWVIIAAGLAAGAATIADDGAPAGQSDPGALATGGIEQPPEHLKGGTLISTVGTITGVDVKNGLVSIEGPEGAIVTVMVDSGVTDLSKVKVGDQVDIAYYAGSMVEIVDPDTPRGEEIRQGRVAPGVEAREVTTTVHILGVDPYKKTVAFRGPDGRFREVSVDDPSLLRYLDVLKEGDTVQVIYTEAIAASIQPTR